MDAYRTALEVRTRENVPLDWAATQANLGDVLLKLGKRERGTERFEQAVDAYLSALEEFTRERVPFQWAKTQTHLGNALFALGVRVDDIELLEWAEDAYRSALDEFHGDWPSWHREVVRKNLDSVMDGLRQKRIETCKIANGSRIHC